MEYKVACHFAEDDDLDLGGCGQFANPALFPYDGSSEADCCLRSVRSLSSCSACRNCRPARFEGPRNRFTTYRDTGHIGILGKARCSGLDRAIRLPQSRGTRDVLESILV
ncbi:hypothetical protein Q31a_13540 [Aureliella helgolandensis]|uniref:Uncharacterized protein n=1 Tax=Aureliella helgolandensis TaxID=2527968 RepID=A0A518G3E6_9BACT|nr:hypothetical protein Q31a_13540 [Aureliella helgolandensis]